MGLVGHTIPIKKYTLAVLLLVAFEKQDQHL